MTVDQSRLYGVWDAVVVLATFYAAITIPVEMSFKTIPASFSPSHWLISSIFLLDFISRARRFRLKTIKREHHEFENKSWFQRILLLTDLLAAVPFFLFTLPPFFKLVSLFKLFRVHYLFKTYRSTIIQYARTYTFLSFIFWILVAINGLACGWQGLHVHESEVRFTTNYINSLYWTITTLTSVGYGDIIPVSIPQKIYAIFLEVLGFGVFTFLIGTVASRLMRKDPATLRYQENIDALSALLHYRHLPGDLRNRILDFYKYMREKRLGYDETVFLKSLPGNLQTEVALYLKKEVIEKVTLFKNASDEFKREIALLLKPIFLMPGDYTFKAGDVGDRVYFVVNGELEVLTRSEDHIIAVLGPGDFFGEIALFKNKKRTATIKAHSKCNLYSLEKSSFEQVITTYPEIGNQIRETIELREKQHSV
jgi:hypothetical protein